MAFLPAFLRVEKDGAAPTRTAWFLHGIFGSSRNWRSFLARFVEACPDWRAIGVDLRHHGNSRGAPPPDTLRSCAEDLERLWASLGLGWDAVVAHSFGGKVALEHLLVADEKPGTVFVLDSPPGAGPGGREPPTSVVGRVLGVIRSMPGPLARRGEAVLAFRAQGIPEPVARWMASSLVSVDGGYVFDFDVPALEALLSDYWARDYRGLYERPPQGVTLHAVLGGKSARIDGEELAWHEETAARGTIRLTVLPDSGHWLHVDDPDGLVRVLASGLG